jgi:hypothetical protein
VRRGRWKGSIAPVPDAWRATFLPVVASQSTASATAATIIATAAPLHLLRFATTRTSTAAYAAATAAAAADARPLRPILWIWLARGGWAALREQSLSVLCRGLGAVGSMASNGPGGWFRHVRGACG